MEIHKIETPPYAGYVKGLFSRIGLALIVIFLCQQVFGFVLAMLAQFFAPKLLAAQPWIMLALSTLPLYGIGIPLARLVLQTLPATGLEQRSFPAGKFAALTFICIFFGMAGNLASLLLTWLLSLLLPAVSGNVLETALEGVPVWTFFVFVVVLAPFFEELFFRKWLLDRIAQYGEAPAILVSGLAFGLFHGNLHQLFYATLLGCALAFLYLRSGKLWLCVLLHAVFNFLMGFLGVALLPLGSGAAALFVFLLFGAAIAGLVLFCINFGKRRNIQKASAPKISRLAFGNAGMIVYLVLMGLTILLMLLSPSIMYWLG